MPSAVPIPTAVALAVRNCPYRWRTNSSPGLSAQATRVSRKSDPGEAMAYMLKRQDGLRGPGLARSGAYEVRGLRGPGLARRSPSILDDGRVGMD